MTTKTTARVRDGIHHAAAEEAQRNWLQDLVSRCFTCPALKQSAVAYQQIPRHLQGLPPAHKKNREPSLCGDDSLLVESSSPCLIRFELFSAHRRSIFGCIFRRFKKVEGLRDITGTMGSMSRSVVAHRSLIVEEPVAIRDRRYSPSSSHHSTTLKNASNEHSRRCSSVGPCQPDLLDYVNATKHCSLPSGTAPIPLETCPQGKSPHRIPRPSESF